MKRILPFLLFAFGAMNSMAQSEHLLDEGVSWELAEYRKNASGIHDLHYQLSFSIPEDKTEDIEGVETVSFTMRGKSDIILDFRESKDRVRFVMIDANGKEHGKEKWKPCEWKMVNDHIVIPKRYTRNGTNRVKISFVAGNQSINRRDSYVYTLFVPDRARTAFPCFEQPNLKATFALDLEIPEGWKAVTNGQPQVQVSEKHSGWYDAKPGYKRRHFAASNPIPTYLFAFAAGDFEYQRYTENGHTIGAYYRETDSARIAQLPEIMRQVVFSMDWQADFTGVPYPFEKYDLVILPGFQFGGMEHTGATFYNDNTLFLSKNPTPDELLRRTELIAHETSHMWFGDAVTMNWFDDVWTKEVFANYFAAEITAPLFPELNHDLNWLKTYTAAAISQDRTEGRTSIRQPLDNMRYAGLIYNNIIYNKAPVMMRKMVELMGKDAFRRGIQKYVKTYLYGNATWDDLIAILDAEVPGVDLRTFSKEWVDSKYWPHLKAMSANDPRIGKDYGYIELTAEQCEELINTWQSEPNAARRQALLMALYENYLNHKIEDARFLSALIEALKVENDPLTSLTLVSYMYEPLSGMERTVMNDVLGVDHTANNDVLGIECSMKNDGYGVEAELLELSKSHHLPAVRTQLLRLLRSEARTPAMVDTLYNIWQKNDDPLLSENDYMTLAYELAVRMPDRAGEIISTQRARLANPDRIAQFDYVSRAVNPSEAARDSLFESLSNPDNRRIEPWTLSVLYYLNHPLRDEASVKYIRPALELLPDIQRTGDIFFPANWCNNLLSGHRSIEAYNAVESFLNDNPEMLELLRNKILQAEYFLKRVNAKRSND